MHPKLTLVAVLIGYHLYCGKLINDFKQDKNQRSHVWYRWFNELPVVVLTIIVILVVVKPF
jgi:putative membrane protein